MTKRTECVFVCVNVTKHIAIATQKPKQKQSESNRREKKNLEQRKFDSEKLQEELSSQLILVCVVIWYVCLFVFPSSRSQIHFIARCCDVIL